MDALAADDKSRTDFLKACLSKLGLQVTDETTTVPSLSSMHLSALDPTDTAKIVESLQKNITKDGDIEYLKDSNDTFRLEKPGVWSMDKLEESLPAKPEGSNANQGLIDYNAIVKRLVPHNELPSTKATPYFNHNAFYSNLRHYQAQSKEGASEFGSNLLYAEVITSTNTILEKCVRFDYIFGFYLTRLGTLNYYGAYPMGLPQRQRPR